MSQQDERDYQEEAYNAMLKFEESCELCGEQETVDNPVADFVPEGTTAENFDPATRILAHGECGYGSGYRMA